MKKSLLFLAITLASYATYAQTNNLPANGNVGIGTSTPNAPLQVLKASVPNTNVTLQSWSPSILNYDLTLSNYNSNYGIDYRFTQFHVGNPIPVLTFRGGEVGIGTTTPTPGTLFNVAIPTSKTDPVGKTAFFLSTNEGIGAFGLRTMIYGGTAITNRYVSLQTNDIGVLNGGSIILQPFDGNVCIGTTTPDAKLAVNGTIHSKEVKVAMQGFPDYVFKPDYHLRSLTEVKTYIDQNHHLPEMPTEKEVTKNGANLGELNKLLVKKIEELTLYLIEQKEETEKLHKEQQKQIDELKTQLNKRH